MNANTRNQTCRMPSRLSPRAWLAALAIAAVQAGCGGGGADGAVSNPPPPAGAQLVARAGADRSVILGAPLTLDGSASSHATASPLSFQWSILGRPPGSQLQLNSTEVTPSFMPDVAGTYRFMLNVSDGRISQQDEVVIVVTGANAAPAADPGGSRSVVTGSSVQLDGSRSVDPNGDALTYAWSLTDRPAGSNATLSSSVAVAPSFTPDRDGDYVATLVVSDGSLSSSPATVLVKAGPANVAPVAHAGPNQFVLKDSLVVLDGTLSSDANRNALTWRWFLTTRPAGSQAALSGAGSARPTFQADLLGDYVITLVVNDGLLDSAPDTVVVKAESGNVRPVAAPGPAQNAAIGSTVRLDGSGSSDANGDALAYTWSLASRPAGSAAALTGAQTASPEFIADVAGDYVLRLLVNDGALDSEPQTLLVRATAANAVPVADAGAAQTVGEGSTVTLDARASSDADGQTLSYAWSLTGRPAGSAAVLNAATSARPTFVADKPGTYVATVVVSDAQSSSAPATVSVTALPASAPAIVLGAAEPLSGTVTVSLTSTASGAVTWFLDLKSLGTGATSNGNALSWNTASTTNGPHQLLARIQSADGSFYEVRRTVQVANSTVTLSASASGTTSATAVVNVSASSTFGIVGVSAQLGQTSLGTLTQPNACSGRLCSGSFNAYQFKLDTLALRSGSYTVSVTATDGAGSTRQQNVPVTISNPPALTLNAPADGALVFGQLQVSGTASTDKAGIVTVSARLGDLEILNTTLSTFATAFDITGVTPGSYTLTVRATDNTNGQTQVQRTVVVSGQAGLALTPAMTLDAGDQVLAAEGARVLLRKSDGSVVSREIGGAQVGLQGSAAVQNVSGWQYGGGGSVVAYGKDAADCVLYCIYRWDVAGGRANLTNPNPHSRAANIGGGWAYDLHPVARDGYVVWVNDKANDAGGITNATGRYTVHQVAQGSYTRVGVPAGVGYVGNNEYDFALVNGVVRFWFWGQTGGEGTTSTFDIFEWRSDTQATTRITQAGLRSVYVQTDGQRAAWQQSPLGGSSDGSFTLMSTSLSGGAATALSASATQFQLKDGVLAWVETVGTGRALKASTAGATRTLSALSTASLYAVGGGAVVYAEQGKAYVWNSATNQARLLVDTAPANVRIAGGHVLFTVGSSLYRVAL